MLTLHYFMHHNQIFYKKKLIFISNEILAIQIQFNSLKMGNSNKSFEKHEVYDQQIPMARYCDKPPASKIQQNRDKGWTTSWLRTDGTYPKYPK